MPHLKVEQAIQDIKDGKMVTLVDDESRENEGDLCMAAEKVTPQAINFMATYGRGLICLAMTADKCDSLDLPPMVDNNQSPYGTGFTVSIEARCGVSTGISAHDRATTILTAVADDCRPICEVMDEDGTMARMPALEKFSEKHGVGICTIEDLIEYRMRTESFVHRSAETVIPTLIAGDFKAIVYENDVDNLLHIAMVKGEIDPAKPVLVRVHSECLTGDIFGSLRCDCGAQLHRAMEMIDREQSGVLLYIRQEGRGIGLVNKIRAYALQDQGLDTVEANEELGFKPDLRNYGIGAQILVDIGVRKMRLLTNNPKKMVGLDGYGLSIVEQVPIEVPANEHNKCYLECKKLKMGHLLNIDAVT